MPSKHSINSNHFFHASPNYRGSPWFDWALVRDPECIHNDGHNNFWYTTANIVIPHYTTLDSVIPFDLLIPSGVDGTLYYVIHTCDDFVNLSDLSGRLIVPFNMWNDVLSHYCVLSAQWFELRDLGYCVCLQWFEKRNVYVCNGLQSATRLNMF